MKLVYWIGCSLIILSSCKLQPGSSENQHDPSKQYKLQLNPANGSSYYYDVINETDVEMDVNGKEVGNESKTELGVEYKIGRDSTGNILFNIVYDKVHLVNKTGDTETEADADLGDLSANPVSRMLAVLKKSKITAVINPTGEVVEVNGYKEMGEEIVSKFDPEDVNGKTLALKQWDQVIGQGMIKRNLDYLFRIFPDSAVYMGDSWKLSSRQEGEFNFTVKSNFQLKSVNPDVAIINSNAKIKSDSTANNVMAQPGMVITNLEGEQEGEFEMETQTGMLIGCRIKAKIKGTINVAGREVPVDITNTIKMTQRKK